MPTHVSVVKEAIDRTMVVGTTPTFTRQRGICACNGVQFQETDIPQNRSGPYLTEAAAAYPAMLNKYLAERFALPVKQASVKRSAVVERS